VWFCRGRRVQLWLHYEHHFLFESFLYSVPAKNANAVLPNAASTGAKGTDAAVCISCIGRICKLSTYVNVNCQNAQNCCILSFTYFVCKWRGEKTGGMAHSIAGAVMV
jgi:hypothetical protein